MYMSEINRKLLAFYEEGITGVDHSKPDRLAAEKIEAILFEEGVKNVLSQLSQELRIKVVTEFKQINDKIQLIYRPTGIYVFREEPAFQVIPLLKELTKTEIIYLITNSLPLIRQEAWDIVKKEYDIYNQSYNNLVIALMNVYSEKRKAGYFNYDAPYFKPENAVVLQGNYYPQGYHFRARIRGIAINLVPESKTYLFDNQLITAEEAFDIIRPAMDKVIEKFKEEPLLYVKEAVYNELKDKYNLSEQELKNITFSSDKKTNIHVAFGQVIIPIGVVSEEVEKAARFAKGLVHLENYSEETYKVTRYIASSIGKGALPENFSVEEAEALSKTVDRKLKEARLFIESGLTLNQPAELPDYGKAFFIKKSDSFEHAGNSFERYEYRLPERKRTHSIMFENGKAISTNRYFRILRKYKAA